MSEHIKCHIENFIMEITLSRPEVKNALNVEMYQTLADHLDQASTRDDIRVVLITGVQGVFTSGNDLNDFLNVVDLDSTENPILKFMLKLTSCPKPVVAAVDGLAIGIGTTLLLHCDFAYASVGALFRVPFVNLGLCPEYASSLLLANVIGKAKANEMLMLGAAMNAEQACHHGLVNEVVDDPLERARAVCKELSVLAPVALRQTKALIKASTEELVEDTIRSEAHVFSELLKGAEFAEAAAAFYEKREADFSKFK